MPVFRRPRNLVQEGQDGAYNVRLVFQGARDEGACLVGIKIPQSLLATVQE